MLLPTIFLIGISLSVVNCQTTFPCNASAPCGCSGVPVVTSRILGGETAVNNSLGWAVSILLNNTYYCSGTLVSQSWVLTSAGCLGYFRSWEIFVSAATNGLLTWKQWRSVTALIRHPGFTPNSWVNDVALLQLASPFNMTDSAIARICMPVETTADYPPINSSVSSDDC